MPRRLAGEGVSPSSSDNGAGRLPHQLSIAEPRTSKHFAEVAGVKEIRARLVVDCMGHWSPIVKQMRGSRKPDGVCLVVGGCATGVPATENRCAPIFPVYLDLCASPSLISPAQDASLIVQVSSLVSGNRRVAERSLTALTIEHGCAMSALLACSSPPTSSFADLTGLSAGAATFCARSPTRRTICSSSGRLSLRRAERPAPFTCSATATPTGAAPPCRWLDHTSTNLPLWRNQTEIRDVLRVGTRRGPDIK